MQIQIQSLDQFYVYDSFKTSYIEDTLRKLNYRLAKLRKISLKQDMQHGNTN